MKNQIRMKKFETKTEEPAKYEQPRAFVSSFEFRASSFIRGFEVSYFEFQEGELSPPTGT